MFRALLAGLALSVSLSAAHAGQVRFKGDGHVFHPVFSADGRYIAFEVNKMAGQVDLFVSELQGAIAKDGQRIALPGSNAFSGGDVVAANPAWHPQGTVVFEGSNPGGQFRLYYYTPGGGAASEMITTTDVPGHLMYPTISADGKNMAFVAKVTGNGDIRIRDNASGKLSQATSTPESESFPVFAPDGTELLFTRKHAETEDVFYLRLSDANEKMTTGGPGDQSRPIYAAAGNRILFFDSARGEGQWDLLSVDANGGDGKRIAAGVRLPHRGRPAISPDGQWVAYAFDDPQLASKIVLSRVDGSKTIEIPTEHNACGEPAIGKQGDRILLAYTGLPNSGAEWRSLNVLDITDHL